MHHKLTVLAVTVAATLATVALGLAGTASADGIYQVYGTGGLGLNQRTAPSLSAPVVGAIPDGANIDVVCQLYDDAVTDPATGVTSSVWDQLAGGDTITYVSDLYVTTPGVGVISVTPCQTAGGGSRAGTPGGGSRTETPGGGSRTETPGGGSRTETAGWRFADRCAPRTRNEVLSRTRVQRTRCCAREERAGLVGLVALCRPPCGGRPQTTARCSGQEPRR
jgi:hypothetical protein